MKSKLSVILAILSAAFLLSFKNKGNINSCFLSFKNPTGLSMGATDRVSEKADHHRTLPTSKGDVVITRVDGYRVLYNNNKDVPFVNLKVEQTEEGAYLTDQTKLLENLRYFAATGVNMESNEVIKLEFNGYTIWGVSRNSIKEGSNLGTFVMFPGNDIVVYFYFNNLKPGYRHFETAEEYKALRNAFIDEYTRHLKGCR